MGERVEVNIFGQTYYIAGEKSKEEIEKIAAYVDEKMELISKVTERSGTGGVAVLTSVNIAEEYFDLQDELTRLRENNEQLEKDSSNYVRLWEESKKNFRESKDNMDRMKELEREEKEKYKELEKKCADFENTIFDLQMENIQLKSEIEKLQKA